MTDYNLEEDFDFEVPKPKKSFLKTLFKLIIILPIVLISGCAVLSWYVGNLNQAPSNFPVDTPIVIEQGSSVRAITQQLEEAQVVKSGSFLYYILVFNEKSSELKASTYVFHEPISSFEIADRLVEGDFDTDLIRFTHIEGERVTKLAERAAEVLPEFDADEFVAMAEDLEGKLYPDTYFIPATYTEEEVLNLLLETFDEKLVEYETKIENHPLTLNEILVLASIIEREANSAESKKLVSGILQNRLDIGMALQADASIEYVLDKPLSELLPSDLEIDSPYNTYLYPGLPPTPIGNPGIEAIEAVLSPTESDYFYYITGNDGEFYYAETYRQHLVNIEKYLR